MRWWLLVGVSAALQAPTVTPLSTTSFKIGAPVTVTELDLGKLKGDLRRLSWSPDARSIHLQTGDGAARHDFVVSLDPPHAVTPAAAEPEWAATYWRMKSDLTAPGTRISIQVVKDSQKRDSSFLGGAPTIAGSIERDPTPEFEPVIVYELYDEPIGKWINKPAAPGETFGWGPEATGLIAFVNVRGQVILRAPHERQMIPGVQDALFPAWSTDGHKVAYVQKTGRKRFALVWVPVAGNTP
jgi:hypothetical protein